MKLGNRSLPWCTGGKTPTVELGLLFAYPVWRWRSPPPILPSALNSEACQGPEEQTPPRSLRAQGRAVQQSPGGAVGVSWGHTPLLRTCAWISRACPSPPGGLSCLLCPLTSTGPALTYCGHYTSCYPRETEPAAGDPHVQSPAGSGGAFFDRPSPTSGSLPPRPAPDSLTLPSPPRPSSLRNTGSHPAHSSQATHLRDTAGPGQPHLTPSPCSFLSFPPQRGCTTGI